MIFHRAGALSYLVCDKRTLSRHCRIKLASPSRPEGLIQELLSLASNLLTLILVSMPCFFWGSINGCLDCFTILNAASKLPRFFLTSGAESWINQSRQLRTFLLYKAYLSSYFIFPFTLDSHWHHPLPVLTSTYTSVIHMCVYDINTYVTIFPTNLFLRFKHKLESNEKMQDLVGNSKQPV